MKRKSSGSRYQIRPDEAAPVLLICNSTIIALENRG